MMGGSDHGIDSTGPDQAFAELETGPLESGIAGSGQRKRRRPEPTPLQRALGLLTRREHSRKELVRKLTDRGVEPTEAATAVEKLGNAGWQDDVRFAQSMVRSRAGNGYGPLRIRAELAMHGLDREAVAAAVEAYEGDWLDNARGLVHRRYGNSLDDLAVRHRAAAMLARRGFGAEHIRAAIRFDPDDPE